MEITYANKSIDKFVLTLVCTFLISQLVLLGIIVWMSIDSADFLSFFVFTLYLYQYHLIYLIVGIITVKALFSSKKDAKKYVLFFILTALIIPVTAFTPIIKPYTVERHLLSGFGSEEDFISFIIFFVIGVVSLLIIRKKEGNLLERENYPWFISSLGKYFMLFIIYRDILTRIDFMLMRGDFYGSFAEKIEPYHLIFLLLPAFLVWIGSALKRNKIGFKPAMAITVVISVLCIYETNLVVSLLLQNQ